MSQRLSIFAVFVLVIAILGFGTAKSLYAQESQLPEGWCEQPSDIHYSFNANFSLPLGRSDGGIRVLYQPYNQRVVLQRTVPREIVQVVESGVSFNGFQFLRYVANCRYLIATFSGAYGQSNVVVYDLLNPVSARMGIIPNAGHNRSTIQSSPDGTYLLVNSTSGLYLWNLTTNIQTHLTALIQSDCNFASVVGCSGELRTYRAVRWDVPHGLLQLDLINNYTVTLTLPTPTISRVEGTFSSASPDQLNAAAAAFTSEFACLPRVQYQAYNRRIILKSHLSNTLVAVVEDNLNLSGFQFLGWSATCTYIAAAIQDEDGLRLAAWNVNDMSRRERPLTDWVDRSSWARAGDILDVITDGGNFEWDLNS